jgi:polyphosphate kinase
MVIQEDEAHDLLASVHRGLRRRRRGPVAMLQIEAAAPARVVERLMRTFNLDENRVYRVEDRIGFGDWMELAALPRQELRYASAVTGPIWSTDPKTTVLGELRHHDRLVHHPYESFNTVEAFVQTAVTDPSVVAIKIALYRIGTNSLLVDQLVAAAKAGKQVTVLVELKARFDEEINLNWATELKAAGAHVVYGSLKLKTHAKVCLVLQKTDDGGRGYVHIGTGNYNAQTARLYTDLGLFTARPAIVQDATDLFAVMAGKSRHPAYRELLVAPAGLRAGLIALIDHEADEARASRPAHIIIKVNSLTDPEVIRAMYRASQAGVRIELIVRGICSLRPGVAGVSESISVRSVIGRLLEHSRIFWFQNGQTPRVFIGSADIMERSFDRRIEVLCPVHDPRLVAHLRNVVLGTLLRGMRRTSILQSDGAYRPARDVLPGGRSIDAQEALTPRYAALRRSRRSRQRALAPAADRGPAKRATATSRVK